MELVIKGIGRNERRELREKISEFVKENFDLLCVGAHYSKEVSLQDADYYCTSRRISIINKNRETRLHEDRGLKYAAGVKDCEIDISEEELVLTINQIQELINEAAVHRNCSFSLKIESL